MTGHLDRYGEPIEEEDLTSSSFCQKELDSTRRASTRDEIHRDRIAELRRILADGRRRREADQ